MKQENTSKKFLRSKDLISKFKNSNDNIGQMKKIYLLMEGKVRRPFRRQ